MVLPARPVPTEGGGQTRRATARPPLRSAPGPGFRHSPERRPGLRAQTGRGPRESVRRLRMPNRRSGLPRSPAGPATRRSRSPSRVPRRSRGGRRTSSGTPRSARTAQSRHERCAPQVYNTISGDTITIRVKLGPASGGGVAGQDEIQAFQWVAPGLEAARRWDVGTARMCGRQSNPRTVEIARPEALRSPRSCEAETRTVAASRSSLDELILTELRTILRTRRRDSRATCDARTLWSRKLGREGA